MEALDKMFYSSLRFLNWENAGTVYALGCPVREVIKNTNYPKQAYESGKNAVKGCFMELYH